MPGPVFPWQRRSAWVWIIRGLVAVLYLLWSGRRLARGIDGCERRAIEEFGCAAAPLVFFALLWLLADSPQRPKVHVRPA